MIFGGEPERPHEPDYEKYDNSRKEHKLERFNQAEANQHNKKCKRKGSTLPLGVPKQICVEGEDATEQEED